MRKTVPLVFGLITFVLLLVLLWPSEPKTVPVVVAATDLGAGATLTPADVQVVEMAVEAAPPDAVTDPAEVVGQMLAVVRFAGEPITPRHLGAPVELQPDERAVAVRVQADTGLAGLLRPGMKVGVVATLKDTEGNVYAKTTVEGLRVLYVPPTFMAQQTTVSASMTLSNDETGLLSAAPVAEEVREGVIVLAASVKPQAIAYEMSSDEMSSDIEDEGEGVGEAVEIVGTVRRVVPVEMLAALNAADALTLVLVPEDAQPPYTTTGFVTSDLLEETR